MTASTAIQLPAHSDHDFFSGKNMKHRMSNAAWQAKADRPGLSGGGEGGAQKDPSSYGQLLQGPIAKIASNVPERSDAVAAAILGYN
ncbi:hypothetical protein EVC45_31710 [Paraburkholderia sp. UYCP14C]|uniref:hypothetical protein n=1 Tax=Paraburkholderia sp. UYCP14C TaxID=2511130 RepID=UPI001020CA2E|nr:hypothetical protein [Paraburkholderia sp. UYCP14C]RZF25717.1 hypothetical protein EVC45_31710 [Paraburkholderia sp. UYCP14C]